MAKSIPNFEEIIKQAVEAGRLLGERATRDAYKATEKRLYALPILQQKIADDKERLAELLKYGTPEHSKSIVRYSRTGGRLSPDEMLDAVVRDLQATIAADEYEVETVGRALASVAEDIYFLSVSGRFVQGLTDEEIAKQVFGDKTTVWRNRKRLVQRIAVRLYGSEAVK